MSLEPEVLERIRKDYPAEQLATVTALLEHCGTDYGGNRAKVQPAILKLAQGDLELVKHYVEVSTTDFRDVLYWAYGRDDDPFRLLVELRDRLANDGIISDEDDTSLGLIGTHQGLLREFEQLCDMLQHGQQSVSAEQLDTIKKLVQRFRLPARVWKSLATEN